MNSVANGELIPREIPVLNSRAAPFTLLFPHTNLIVRRFRKGKDLHDVHENLFPQLVGLELDASDIDIVVR